MTTASPIWAFALVSMAIAIRAQASVAQEMSVPAYCPDLKRVAALAMSQERFASITGKPREGNFSDTSLTLSGWHDCALYGNTTYTCDSPALDSAQAAEQAQAAILQEAKTCLGKGWSESTDLTSANY